MLSSVRVFGRRFASKLARVADDATIHGNAGQPMMIRIGKCDDISILRGCRSSDWIGELRIVAGTVHGDIDLRKAAKLADKVTIAVRDMEGDVHFPKKSFFTGQSTVKASSSYLRLSIGSLSTEDEAELASAKAAIAQLPGKDGLDRIEATVEDVVIRPDKEEAMAEVTLGQVGDDVDLLPRYDGQPIPSLTIIAQEIDEIDF